MEVAIVHKTFLIGVIVILGCGLVVLAGCTDETAADSEAPQATATTNEPEGAPGMAERSTTVTQSAVTTVAVPTTEAVPTTAESSVVHLGESDNDRQVMVQVGDLVRIQLEPEAGKVIAVRWDFTRGVVEYFDSGWTEMEGATIADCWLELEVRNAGSVTLRARYEWTAGYVSSPWACYLVAKEKK